MMREVINISLHQKLQLRGQIKLTIKFAQPGMASTHLYGFVLVFFGDRVPQFIYDSFAGCSYRKREVEKSLAS